MKSHRSSLHSYRMPPELLLIVLSDLWASCPNSEERWRLYASVSPLSRAYRRIMTYVALRHVFLHSKHDFDVYRMLILGYLGKDPSSEVEQVDMVVARDFFKRAELHIELTDYSAIGPFKYNTDYSIIPRYIPTCRLIDVVIAPHPGHDSPYTPQYEPLFECLAQYQDSAPEVHISWTYTHMRDYVVPAPIVRGVRYLRLHDYPRCHCRKNVRLRPGEHVHASQLHGRKCFSFLLPTLFTDLEHLRIDTPFILKGLSVPPSCTKLEIEAPPVHFLPERGFYGSLVNWNVVSALSSGLMQFAEEKGPKTRARVVRTIVVHTGPEEPDGWSAALKACKSRHVRLERRITFKVPRSLADVKREEPRW